MSEHSVTDPTHRYDRAAGQWGDKMRTLGYYDGYLGFLSAFDERPVATDRVLDIGSGTGAFAEAWVALHGRPAELTLLDPSKPMLERASAALTRRNAPASLATDRLDQFRPDAAFDHLLAAHVIEHFADPRAALCQMRDLAKPGAKLWLVASKPHWCNAIIWFQWRHRTFQNAEIEALLSDSGWALQQVYAFPSGPPSRTSRGYQATAM